MLALENVNTYYWRRQVLRNVSLKVPEGRIVAMLGRNGMGKTTIIRSIMGLTPPRSGEIRFGNDVISGLEPYQIARKGIALVPQGRGVFSSLSVKEHLTVAARKRNQGDWDIERIYASFPILKERSHSNDSLLSGGEQQMLAISRALMTNPDVLLMDELSEGLAPLVVHQISQIIRQLRGSMTVFLAEQNINMALNLADNIYIISQGEIAHESGPQALVNNHDIKIKYLGV